jgi:hypothetical protein
MFYAPSEIGRPLTFSHIRTLTQLTIYASISTYPNFSPIPAIISLVTTSPSLKLLILRTPVDPQRFELTAVSDLFRPLVSLVDHSSLDHIELRIALFKGGLDWSSQKVDILVTPLLMKVPELKELFDKGFLSVTGDES